MSFHTVRVGLVGVTGYTGMELVRLLEGHLPPCGLWPSPRVKKPGLNSPTSTPFRGFASGELIVSEPDPAALAKECDLVFLAIPHGAAMDMGAALTAEGCKVVDLPADFRIHDKAVYEQVQGGAQTACLSAEAVYGLPELYAGQVASARLVANPGCYPTASILGLYPALAGGLIDPDDVVIDAKSGTSGAGRGLAVGSLFCEVHDSFRAYNLGAHRHTPEIEQELSAIAGRPVFVSFNTHLLPINRGILATIYTKLKDPGTTLEKRAAYTLKPMRGIALYVFCPQGLCRKWRAVRGTMFCDIGLVVDPRTKRLIIVTAIDNLCRGASGQAVANANLMLGLPLETGLNLAPMVP